MPPKSGSKDIKRPEIKTALSTVYPTVLLVNTKNGRLIIKPTDPANASLLEAISSRGAPMWTIPKKESKHSTSPTLRFVSN